MARISCGLSKRWSVRAGKGKTETDGKDTSTEMNSLFRPAREDRLTARFGFTEMPENSMGNIPDYFADYEEKINPFDDAALPTAPTINEQAWEALVSGNNNREFEALVSGNNIREFEALVSGINTWRGRGLARSSSLSSRRRSLVGPTSNRRSLCEMMCDAASTGDVPQIGRLLGAGADPKKKSKEGLSPVHLAAIGGHLGVLKSLAMHGAKMEATDALERTALHAAVVARQADVIPFLVQSGVPIDAKDVDGCTALQLASEMETEGRSEELDLENAQNSKVRFSYIFGASTAAKRMSTCSTSSMSYSPVEALLRAGASVGDVRVESRL
ncbi:ankyrin repeat protein [Venturia nashicola]|uniref:Ankyrin repeat protein n=1 Tax=Venturia nashicola TaxID=86259 RepID=A0A4Z1P1Y8_9PEZI|nr:ankyrin repeat protein [Venturia nashicola]